MAGAVRFYETRHHAVFVSVVIPFLFARRGMGRGGAALSGCRGVTQHLNRQEHTFFFVSRVGHTAHRPTVCSSPHVCFHDSPYNEYIQRFAVVNFKMPR